MYPKFVIYAHRITYLGQGKGTYFLSKSVENHDYQSGSWEDKTRLRNEITYVFSFHLDLKRESYTYIFPANTLTDVFATIRVPLRSADATRLIRTFVCAISNVVELLSVPYDPFSSTSTPSGNIISRSVLW